MEKYYVYRFLNSLREVVYVGKTRQPLEDRIHRHFGSGGHLQKAQLATVTKVEFLELKSRVEMDIVELYYINLWRPIFNTQAKYEEEFSLDNREGDCWVEFEFTVKEETAVETEKDFPSKMRVEVVLSEVDADIIEHLELSDKPKSAQFKIALRTQIQRKQDEQIDDRIKRLLYDTMSSISAGSPGDYKQAWLHEKAEKERLADELEALRDSLRQLVPSE